MSLLSGILEKCCDKTGKKCRDEGFTSRNVTISTDLVNKMMEGKRGMLKNITMLQKLQKKGSTQAIHNEELKATIKSLSSQYQGNLFGLFHEQESEHSDYQELEPIQLALDC